jgi:hypothetical protein
MITGIVLLVVGVVAVLGALAVYGAPWGFRGAPAILVEAIGDVEITAGRAPQSTLAATPGLRLQIGDVVRVGRFSEARLRFPTADVALKDGARALLADGRVVLGRGVAEIVVQPGARAAQIDVEGPAPETPDARITVQPGRAVVSCDGKGTCAVVVQEGSAQASGPLGGESAEPAQALVLQRGAAPVVQPAPTKVALTAECRSTTKSVVGTAALGTQVYLNGKMDYADAAGRFSLPWPPGATEAILFARDAAGNVDRKLVVCSP